MALLFTVAALGDLLLIKLFGIPFEMGSTPNLLAYICLGFVPALVLYFYGEKFKNGSGTKEGDLDWPWGPVIGNTAAVIFINILVLGFAGLLSSVFSLASTIFSNNMD